MALVCSQLALSLSGCSESPPSSNASPVTKPAAVEKAGVPKPPMKPVPLDPKVLTAELRDVDKKSFKLSDYSGKVVVVNLWATWCGPCRVEIPELIKLSDERKGDVVVIGLTSEDPVTDEAKVRDFMKRFNITYRIGWSTEDVAHGLMQGNIQYVIPQSFVITREGHVYKRLIGFSAKSTPAQLQAAVNEALNYKSEG